MLFLVVMIKIAVALPSMRRDDYPELPGNERITRSVEDLSVAANTVIFRPLFRSRDTNRRVLRSLNGITRDILVELPGYERISKRSVDSLEELMETAANTVVFRPLFRSRNSKLSQRVLRSAEEQNNVEDDMETAANTIVFRPLFRDRDRTSRKRILRQTNS